MTQLSSNPARGFSFHQECHYPFGGKTCEILRDLPPPQLAHFLLLPLLTQLQPHCTLDLTNLLGVCCQASLPLVFAPAIP